jgi:hypothetical protein
MTSSLEPIPDIRISVKLAVAFVVSMLVFSTGVLAFPAPVSDIVNTTAPAYYEIEGPYRLTHDEHRSLNPAILIDDDDNMHVLWDDSRNDPDPDDTAYVHEMFYKKYDADGNVVVNDTRLINNTSINVLPWRYYYPAPSVDMDSDGNIHVTYIDYKYNTHAGGLMNVEIYYMKLDGGLDEGGAAADRADIVLIDEQRVSNGVAFSGDPDLKLDSDDNVHIVWYDHRSTWWNYEIYYEKLSVDGAVLKDDVKLTSYMDYNAGPEMVIDTDDNLHIVFKNYIWSTGTNSVYYMKTDSDGGMVESPKKIATEGVQSYMRYSNSYPGIAIDDDDNLHVAWNDYRDGNDFDVFYLKLDSDGDALMTSPKAITDNTGNSQGGAVAIDADGRILLPIRDDTSGDHQLHIAILDTDGSYHLEPYQVTVSDSLSQSAALGFDSEGNFHWVFVDTITWDPELYHMIFKPTLMDLGIIAYGELGSQVDITIYEDDVEIASGTIIRDSTEPKEDMYTVELEINVYASYDIELEYTPPQEDGKRVNGAMLTKICLMEDGEISETLGKIVFKYNPQKPQTSGSYNLDDDINDYF